MRPAAPSPRVEAGSPGSRALMLPRMLGVFDRARSLCTSPFLVRWVLPSNSVDRLGTWERNDFAAQYPAYVFPCQRLRHVLAAVPT